MRVVASHRTEFRGSVFLCLTPFGAKPFKFCFAVQSPVTVWFSQVAETPLPEPAGQASSSDAAAHLDSFAWDFAVDFLNAKPWFELPQRDAAHIEVVRGFIYHLEDRTVSEGVARPLADVLNDLPPMPEKKPKMEGGEEGSSRQNGPRRSAPKHASWLDSVLDEDWDAPAGVASSSKRHSKKSKPKVVRVPEPIDDEHIEALLIEFRKAVKMYDGGDLAAPGWRVRPLGGEWLARSQGKAFDHMYAAPRHNSSELKWATKNGLGAERRWSVEFYGVEAAHVLASTYAHKAQWFYDQWEARSELALTAYEPYVEPPEFVCLFEHLPPRQLRQAQRIRDWWPLAPL